MGARSHEPRAKIFARSANILVFAKRCGVRFAFEPKAVGELAHQWLGEESSLLRSKNEYPSATSGQSRTPVPTKDTLHFSKNMV